MAADKGGFLSLGFNETKFEKEYKMKPDYLTDTLFMAERAELPSYKEL
jgi:hypothetical protein